MINLKNSKLSPSPPMGWIGANDNGVIFPNNTSQDVFIAVETPQQVIRFGTSNVDSVLNVCGSVVGVNGTLTACNLLVNSSTINSLTIDSNLSAISMNVAQGMFYDLDVTNMLTASYKISAQNIDVAQLAASNVTVCNLDIERLNTRTFYGNYVNCSNVAALNIVASNVDIRHAEIGSACFGLSSMSNMIVDGVALIESMSCSNIDSSNVTIPGLLRAKRAGVMCLNSEYAMMDVAAITEMRGAVWEWMLALEARVASIESNLQV